MPFYSTNYLNNIKICLNRAIAIQAVDSSVRAAYLIEKCRNCSNPVPDGSNLNAWLAIVTAWDNTSVDTNVITEAAFKSVIEDISISLSCAQPSSGDGGGGGTSLSATITASGTALTVGASLTLTSTPSGGTAPYTHQWQKDSANITGATNATLVINSTVEADSGAYKDLVTDSVQATVTSNIINITVTPAQSNAQITYGWSATDPYVNNTTAISVPNATILAVAHNANLSFNFPQQAPDNYIIVKEPVSEIQKTAFNNGTNTFVGNLIPPTGSDEFREPFVVGGFRYYVSRNLLAFLYTQPLNFTS